MTSDPPRLLDDPTASAALRADMVHASEAQLHGFDFAAGLAKLQSATGTGAVATVTASSLTAKLGVTALVAAAAAAVWLGSRDPSPPAAQATAPTPSAEPDALGELGEVSPSGPTHAEPTDALPPIEPEPVAPPKVEPPVVSPAPSEAAEMPTEPEADEREPAAAEPVRKHVRRATPSEPSEEPAPLDDQVIREARAVAQARAKLSGDPARALALLEDAEREFPAGQLVEERRALAIQALAALGRHDEAKARADVFLARYGKGAHAAAVRRAIAARP